MRQIAVMMIAVLLFFAVSIALARFVLRAESAATGTPTARPTPTSTNVPAATGTPPPPPPPMPSPAPPTFAGAPGGAAGIGRICTGVRGGKVNLRIAANGRVLRVLDEGTLVRVVMQSSDGWAMVEDGYGTGWVWGTFVVDREECDS